MNATDMIHMEAGCQLSGAEISIAMQLGAGNLLPSAPDRSTYIGGSDTAAILGVSPWLSPFMLYQKKIGTFVEEITPAKQKLFDRGHRWEPIVVEMLIDELRDRGHDVEIIARNRRYQDPEFPFLAAEIDLELLVDGEEVNGEAKTVNPFAAKLWGEEDTDDIPIYYAAQVMHGLMIRPRRRTVIAALTGFDDKPRVHWIDRDEETIAGIRAKEIEFWERVQSRNAPDPTDPADVKWLYQRDGGTVFEADDELAQAIQELRDMKAKAKNLEALIDLSATRVKARMGEAATLIYQGKPLATWKNNKDSSKTDWKAIAEELLATQAVIAAHTKTTPGARPFVLK
ncbi:MAG: YqaJ viral recombinase family protein [Thiobacillus sp.]|nr:YqaJ viral recombinase family protein [Thiobacillus sp.]